ncbi:alpha-L-rhamnosidase C-terminal domain-containing protein [Hyphomonas johnsonii]|uniref:Alpha-L-rhamnosidase n=1 Tax=Hyphomonas johnsonii MHS-2 TaxID=1280950 RepID=A0A059FS37_9PROT|nr:alpha-L-rhamnosidase C-terminal domain-containing protein [Hyphomonas johnsonii]KCZ93469.1 alpha-L-rhamnosidase [Hyphomonas johnsonii MHS-2]
MRTKADFIWSPDQSVNLSAYGAMMHGGSNRRDDGENRWFFLRRSFDLDQAPSHADLSLTVDGRYRLSVNGTYVGFGPARSVPQRKSVDHYDLTGHLRAGRNVLAALVYVPGTDLAWYQAMRGSWQPVFGDGGLWAFLEGVCGGESFEIASDELWKIKQADCWRQDVPREGWGQGHMEDIDGVEYPDRWCETDFDDSGWDFARRMKAEGDCDDQAIGRGRSYPFPVLTQRIPHLLEHHLESATDIVWSGAVSPLPDLPLNERLFREAPCADNIAGAVEPSALLSDRADCVLKTSGDADAAIVLAFRYHTGFPFVEIEASGGEIIEIAVSERLPGEFDGGSAGPLRHMGVHAVSNLLRYTARPGRQRIEKFEWAAIRAMQVTVRNAPEGLILRAAGSRAISYPVARSGVFTCSDPELSRLWDIGANTAHLCMHDAWEDCPGREKRQWVGDAAAAFQIASSAFGADAIELHRNFLLSLSDAQRQDGLFPMFGPGDQGENGVVIPDFSLHYIMSAATYLTYTGDLATVESIMAAVERSLDRFAAWRGPNGLLSDIPEWNFIEWANVGRDGESAVINALYAGALAAAASLAEAVERPRLRTRWLNIRDQVKDALNARLWSPERGAYADCADPVSGKKSARISQQANALMIVFDLAPRHRWDQMLDVVTDRRRVHTTAAPPIVETDQPFDPESDVVAAGTFYSTFLFDALARGGRFGTALDAMRSAYGPMLDSGTTTLWESYAPNASLCHVFSASPVHHLSANILGVRPTSAGYRSASVAISPSGLDWAKGTVPTPHGNVDVDWTLVNDTLNVWVKAPDAIVMTVQTPAGFEPIKRSQQRFVFRRLHDLQRRGQLN